jgi:hypothetical protein
MWCRERSHTHISLPARPCWRGYHFNVLMLSDETEAELRLAYAPCSIDGRGRWTETTRRQGLSELRTFLADIPLAPVVRVLSGILTIRSN